MRRETLDNVRERRLEDDEVSDERKNSTLQNHLRSDQIFLSSEKDVQSGGSLDKIQKVKSTTKKDKVVHMRSTFSNEHDFSHEVRKGVS